MILVMTKMFITRHMIVVSIKIKMMISKTTGIMLGIKSNLTMTKMIITRHKIGLNTI